MPWMPSHDRPGPDPYFDWAMRTAFAYYFPEGAVEDRVPVIMELVRPMTARRFAIGDWHHPRDWRALIRVPSMYRHPAPALDATSFCTANVRLDFFDRLRADPGLQAVIQRVELGLPTETRLEVRGMLLLPGLWPPNTVVTGIIDDGLAFGHERFRRLAGTRVSSIWNQDGPFGPPAGFFYGLELRKEDVGVSPGLDTRMGACTHAGILDEDELYRVTRHLRYEWSGHKPLAARATHGTHVMDLACGYDEATAPATRPIIGVQLPVRTTADTSGGSLTRYVLDGLRYMLGRAQGVPLVVNLSYGLISGPHDGSSILETAIDELIQLRNAAGIPFAVVLPAGNNYLSRCHARFELRTNARRMLRWRVQPGDSTPSYLQIWLPHNAPAAGPGIRIRMRSPSGELSAWVARGGMAEWRIGGQLIGLISFHDTMTPGRNRHMIAISLAPTATLRSNWQVAPAGNWDIEIENQGPQALTLDAWIQRDDTPIGYPSRGRQSRFEDPNYRRFTLGGRERERDNAASYVKRDGTINSIATGRRTIVIGGYRRQPAVRSYFSELPSLVPGKYSASGPLVDPPAGQPRHRRGPDAMAVSEESMHRGVLAAGSRSSSATHMRGTSLAAPLVTRLIARRMAAGLPVDRAAVAALAQQAEAARPLPNPRVPRRRGGAGRI